MKLPHFPYSKWNFHSVAVQTVLELTVGAIVIALLMRWLEMQ
jgi:hypothetical protein